MNDVYLHEVFNRLVTPVSCLARVTPRTQAGAGNQSVSRPADYHFKEMKFGIDQRGTRSVVISYKQSIWDLTDPWNSKIAFLRWPVEIDIKANLASITKKSCGLEVGQSQFFLKLCNSCSCCIILQFPQTQNRIHWNLVWLYFKANVTAKCNHNLGSRNEPSSLAMQCRVQYVTIKYCIGPVHGRYCNAIAIPSNRTMTSTYTILLRAYKGQVSNEIKWRQLLLKLIVYLLTTLQCNNHLWLTKRISYDALTTEQNHSQWEFISGNSVKGPLGKTESISFCFNCTCNIMSTFVLPESGKRNVASIFSGNTPFCRRTTSHKLGYPDL